MFDLPELLKLIGYAGIAGIVFAESGLLIGFFLPGDSLLFTAGFLASQGFFRIVPLALLVWAAAALGDSAGYAFGKGVGRRLFRREDSLFFHRRHLLRAERFYERHGGKAIVLARFLPFIRTFAPIVAGVGRMFYPRFLAFNVAGGFLWAGGLTISGYFLGSWIPNVDRFLLPIVLGIIAASVLPPALHLGRNPEERERLARLMGQLRQRVRHGVIPPPAGKGGR